MEKCASAAIGPRRAAATRSVAVLLAVGAAFAACSDSGGDADGATAPSVSDPVVEDPGPNFVPTPDDETVGESGGDDAPVSPPTTEFDLSAQPETPSIEPVPETGVPGIDSSDAFCRAWSEFAGSFQALALVSAIGDPAAAFRLEVIAASTVTGAVETMEADLPDELESERVALIADLAGPLFARAVLAEADLLGAGLEPAALRSVWLDALIEGGVDDPALRVVVPDSIDGAALDAAVASFSAAQLAIFEDPALITNASVPLTEAYLADECPDGGILAGNDVILD